MQPVSIHLDPRGRPVSGTAVRIEAASGGVYTGSVQLPAGNLVMPAWTARPPSRSGVAEGVVAGLIAGQGEDEGRGRRRWVPAYAARLARDGNRRAA